MSELSSVELLKRPHNDTLHQDSGGEGGKAMKQLNNYYLATDINLGTIIEKFKVKLMGSCTRKKK